MLKPFIDQSLQITVTNKNPIQTASMHTIWVRVGNSLSRRYYHPSSRYHLRPLLPNYLHMNRPMRLVLLRIYQQWGVFDPILAQRLENVIVRFIIYFSSAHSHPESLLQPTVGHDETSTWFLWNTGHWLGWAVASMAGRGKLFATFSFDVCVSEGGWLFPVLWLNYMNSKSGCVMEYMGALWVLQVHGDLAFHKNYTEW